MASPPSPLPSSPVTDPCRRWWESGGMASRCKTHCVILMFAVRTHPSSPGCFVSPACLGRCLLSDAVGSHTLPHLNDWSVIERFHPYLLRPIQVGVSRIASMPSACFFVLACLSFPLPLYLLLALAKVHARSQSLLSSLFTLPVTLHLPPGKTVQLKCRHMYCDPSCIACHCRLQDLAGNVFIMNAPFKESKV